MAGGRILVKCNGPLFLQGDFEIVDAEGTVYGLGGRSAVSLCRCGQSGNKPFCDGTHGKVGFLEEGRARDLPPKA